MIGTIFIIMAVIFVTAFVFIAWAAFVVVRALIRFVSPAVPPRLVNAVNQRFNNNPGQLRCSRELCRNFNPPTARFCRCCGAMLQVAPVRWQARRQFGTRMSA